MDPFRMNNGVPSVWTGSAYQDLPTYDAADFEKTPVFQRGWNSAWGAQPEDTSGFFDWSSGEQKLREGAAYDPTYSGGDGGSAELGYMQDQYRLTDAARQKYGNLFGGGQSTNWQMNYGTDPNKFSAMLKSGDKVGTTVDYELQNGKYVPKITGMQNWDTNNGKQNMDLLRMAAMVAGGAGMAAGAGGALSSIASGSMPSLTNLGSLVGTLNTVTAGSVPGLREAGLVTSLGGSVGSLGDFATNGVNSLSDVAKLGQTGYNVYSKGNQLMDIISPEEQNANSTFQPRTTATPPYSGTGINQPRWNGMTDGPESMWGNISNAVFGAPGQGTGLLGMYGAYKGTQEARDEAFRLQNLYNDAQGRRQPVLDRLNESYTNPNSFYDSNQWKGLESVYQNSIDRKAAQSGRMANPTDREVLLNNYAMKEMENYRTGLRDQVKALNPDNYIQPFMRGSTREANAGNPWYALGGQGSVGGPGLQGGMGGMAQQISSIAKAFGGVQNIPQAVMRALGLGQYSGMTGGMGAQNPDEYGGMDPYAGQGGMGGGAQEPQGYVTAGEPQIVGPAYPGNDAFGAPQVSYDPFSSPQGSYDPFNTGSMGNYDLPIEDMGWLNDFGDWF